MRNSLLFCACFLLLAFSTSISSAQTVVDVYFIAGQSNAGNLGELNSYDALGYDGNSPTINANSFDNQSEAGFELTFGRIPDRPGRGTVDEVIEAFNESSLDPNNYALDNLAVGLNAHFGDDLAIFSYGRNGRPLTSTTAEETWYPGTVAAPFNSELYGSFLNWSALRIAEVEAGPDGIAGNTDDQIANIRGIFWFQGESDSGPDNSLLYETTFTNLIARFRADFNDPELPIVASEIRGLDAGDNTVNAGLNAVAASDPYVSVIEISDASVYPPVNTGNVHLNADGFLALSSEIANRFIALDAGFPISPTGSLISSQSEPVANVLVDEIEGSSVATLINSGAANGARGSQFTVGTVGQSFDIDSLTIQANNPDTFGATEQFTVAFFTGSAGSFPASGTTNNVSPEYLDVNSGLSLIRKETFVAASISGSSADGTISNNGYITFNLTDDLIVHGGVDITVLVYTNFAFSQREGNGSAGRLLFSSSTTAFNEAGGRNFRFLISGTEEQPCFDLGDINLDGVVNFLDIAPLIGHLTAGTYQCEADINQDSVVSFLDIGPFVSLLSNITPS